MTMLADMENRAPMTLAHYEARIEMYKEQIGAGYIGIGRTLNEAKDAKVVPHGQWEAWVERVAGMDIQVAQKCMRAAREIRDGSALAKLEMSKAIALLASGLDQDTQETMAQKAAEEGESLKALRAEIEQKKQELAQVRMQSKTAFDNMHEQLLKEGQRVVQADVKARQAQEQLTAAEKALHDAQVEADRLREQLALQKKQTPMVGISQEAQAIIDSLRDELDAAEIREEKKAEQLQALREQQHRQAMDDARGVTVSALTGFDLAAAVRAFIGSAGVLPQMGDSLCRLSAADKRTMLENVETVAAWVDGARAALGVVKLDGSAARVE